MLIIILTIIIIIMLLCVILWYKRKQQGGFKTILSSNPMFEDVDNISEQVKNFTLYNDVVNYFDKYLKLPKDNVITYYVNRNILTLFNAVNADRYTISKIYTSGETENTLIGGIVEASVYITLTNFSNDPNFEYNSISVYNIKAGGYNMVFMCDIQGFNSKHKNISRYNFALRVLYNTDADSKIYTIYTTELMNDPDYEKYFIKPIAGHSTITNKTYSDDVTKTYWHLFNVCKPLNLSTMDLDKYLETEFRCLKILHSHEMMFRDWKPENMMELNDKYILTDVDFINVESVNYSYTIRDRGIRKYVENALPMDDYNRKNVNIICDHMVALISWLITFNRRLGNRTIDFCKFFENRDDILDTYLADFYESLTLNELLDSDIFLRKAKEYFVQDYKRENFYRHV